MINPKTIDLSSLPSLPIEQRKNLPVAAGIYFAIDSLGSVQYIGRSANIKQRWLNHHRSSELQEVDRVKLAWIEVSDCSMLPEIESALIEWFKPILNARRLPSLSSPSRGILVQRTVEVEVFNLNLKIKEARKADSRSITELSAAAGMSAANWYRIESGEPILPESTLRKIEIVLGVDFGVRFDD